MKFNTGKPLGELKGLREKNKLLAAENRRIKDHALHILLESLMLSDADEENTAKELKDYLGERIDTSCFAILLIYPEDNWDFAEAQIFSYVMEQFNKHLGCYASLVFFNSNSPKGVSCLIILDNFTPEDVALLGVEIGAEIAELCKHAVDALRLEQGVSVRVAVSPLMFGAENIRHLFREAVTTHDHSYDSVKSVTTSYDLDAAYDEDIQDVNLSALERQFLNFVMGKQFFEAVTVLDKIIDYTITTSRPTLEHTASTCFSRLETVLVVSGIEHAPPPKGNAEIGNILANLMRASDFGQIRDCVHDFFALLDDEFSDVNTLSKIEKVTEYISKNYTLASMGAALICREFKFSASYLSRLFKTELGISTVEYIHSVRIEKAKQLLSQTNETVDNIAVLVGFTNRWTLIRVFKEREGVTPGAFRQLTGGM